MTLRPVSALVPHRGMVWTGVSRPWVGFVLDPKDPGLVVRLAVRAQRDGTILVPGELRAWQSLEAKPFLPPPRADLEWPLAGTRVTVRGTQLRNPELGRVDLLVGFESHDLQIVDGTATCTLEEAVAPGTQLVVRTARGTIFDVTIGFDVRVRVGWLDDVRSLARVITTEIAVDLDSGRVHFVFEGLVAGDDVEAGLDRVAIAVLPPGSEEAWWRELPRSVFGHAAIGDDLDENRLEPAPSGPALETARWSTFEIDEPPGRTLDPSEAHEVAAALAAGEDRASVFERHALDPYEWQVEEYAMTMALAEPPEVDERALASSSFDDDAGVEPDREPTRIEREALAMDAALSAARTPPIDLDTYALLVAAIEAGDGEAALAAHGVSAGAVTASERTWTERAEADPVVKEQLDAAIASARAERMKDLSARLSALAEEPIDLETEAG